MASGGCGCFEEVMRRMMFGTLVLMMILTLAPFAGLSAGEAAGPWKVQIVDAETGEPLEGVVVLAVWMRYTASPGGWAGAKYYDSEEVLTGPDGRFVIPQRTIINWLPLLTDIRGPEFKILKPGYGRWRIKEWEKKPKEWEELTTGEVLEKEGIVIELPPLKTREERLEFLRSPSRSPSALVPPERTRRFDEAERMERAYLGLRN
jgi:hypothetical protein